MLDTVERFLPFLATSPESHFPMLIVDGVLRNGSFVVCLLILFIIILLYLRVAKQYWHEGEVFANVMFDPQERAALLQQGGTNTAATTAPIGN